jgi:Zn-dependent protease with chaperone function
MAINYKERNFLGFQEYIHRTDKAGSETSETPPYAHPVDERILRTLNAMPIKAVMNQTMDALISLQFGLDIANSVQIDRKAFSDLFEMLHHCANTLGIPNPDVIIKEIKQNDKELITYSAGTDEYTFISIAPELLELFSREEALFLIGCECGHIASGHMLYHTLAKLLTNVYLENLGLLKETLQVTAGVFLSAWSRRSEVTADRAGLLCCGDIEIAQTALLRLAVKLEKVDRIDIDEYLRRARETLKLHKLGELRLLFENQPSIPMRIEALRLFADSELYYSLSGKEKPRQKILLSQDELNRQVNEIVKP